MKNILETILTFLKKAFSKDYIGITFGVIILLLVLFNLQTCRNLSYEQKQHDLDNKLNQNNLKALGDTLTSRFDKKVGAIVTEKTSYLVKSVDDLKSYNESFYNDLKNIKGTVAGIQSSVGVIIPSLTAEIQKAKQDPKDSTKFIIPWNFNYKDSGLIQTLVGNTYLKIDKNKPTQPMYSKLDTNSFNIRLKYNVVDEKGQYKVKAYSESPLVKFTDLDSALILDKLPNPIPVKQNPWSFGPYAGFGLNTDIIGSNARFGWSIGVGGSYNLFSGVKGGKIK